MTDNGHDHDELIRRLADEGRASAPPDLAPEVMRRVRAEPRHRERRILRPVATLLAAAVLVVAALAGISRLGNGSAGSASSAAGGGAEQGVTKSPQTDSLAPTASGKVIRHVGATALGPIFGKASVPACARLTATVPGPELHRVEQQLRGAAADTVAGAATRDVELHRAPKGQVRITITCP